MTICKAVVDDVRCTRQACYNIPGNKPKYCSSHKTQDMVDVIHKRCQYVDENGAACSTQPLFNFPGEKGGIRCRSHKTPGMVDVKNKTCQYVDENGASCSTRPYFNFPGEKCGIWCGSHKTNGMVDVIHKMCGHGNHIGRCAECPLGDILYKGMCTCCRVVQVCRAQREIGICAGCSRAMNEIPQRIEKIFGDMIIDFIGHPPNLTDKTVATGESCREEGLDNRRPDLVYVNHETGSAVVIEIDEDSHANRDVSCELRKVSEQTLAIQKLDGLENCSVFTIRVNPDKYDGGSIERRDRARAVSKFTKESLNTKSDRVGHHEIRFMYYHSKAIKYINEYKKFWKCLITNQV